MAWPMGVTEIVVDTEQGESGREEPVNGVRSITGMCKLHISKILHSI